MSKHPMGGSERTELAGSKDLGQYDLNEKVEVRLMLRRQREAELQLRVKKLEAGDEVPPLDRQTFADLYSSSPEDLAKVHSVASAHGLTVVDENAKAGAVVVSGTVAQLQEFFEVKLESREGPNGRHYRARSGPLHIPDELKGIVTAVLGLDNRPQVRSHFSVSTEAAPASPATGSQTTPPPSDAQQSLSFTALEIASLYGFPAGDGKGQCVGIIEAGGGYEESDLTTYFSALGLPMPTIVPIGLGGASNQPNGDPEATLDIEICAAVAPGARFVVYFPKNEDASLIEAIDHAIHDDVNRPSVLSISWGSPESGWTEQAKRTLNNSLQIAAVLGITVCVASGDSGSSNGSTDNVDSVNFPASSPYSLACGGTRLLGSEGAIDSEVVWNDDPESRATGGGISNFFHAPAWQKGLSAARTKGPAQPLVYRGVPDVAGDASEDSGYDIFFGGSGVVAGGTSAVAPLWAGLIARINGIRDQSVGIGDQSVGIRDQSVGVKNKPVGFITPKLYRSPKVCHDVTEGNNGSFAASPGWDACTGLGSPDGQAIAKLLGVAETS